uniref:TRAF-type domain-containing protein n=2 Tax=Setaria italica TaxID=4555 RepID=K4A0C9_SETIT
MSAPSACCRHLAAAAAQVRSYAALACGSSLSSRVPLLSSAPLRPPDWLGSAPPASAGQTWISAALDSSALSRAMAAADSDPTVTASTCANCQREIPSSNIALHSVHCARNLQKCEHCGDMVPRKLMDEHYNENHAPMNCSLCKCTVERGLWDLHTGIQCPQRMLACQYCEFELPVIDLLEHQDVCGNRTEYCETCRKYIRLREWIGHELQFHTGSNSSDGASAAAEPKPARPAAHGSHRKQLLLTIAIAGFAVLIGSILYQRKD